MKELDQYDLIIMDCDGTLCERDSEVYLPGTVEMIAKIKALGIPRVIASNQGAGACAEAGWQTSWKYPTLEQIFARFAKIEKELGIDKVYLSLSFYSDKSKMWCYPMKSIPRPFLDERCDPWWRKPWPGMLITAMLLYNVNSGRVLMVGDSDDDLGAAQAAGVDFCPADTFFGREGTAYGRHASHT